MFTQPPPVLSGTERPTVFSSRSKDDLFPLAFDDGQTSPSLFSLLSRDTVDETFRVRLWVQQRSDGGFWEAEAVGTRQTTLWNYLKQQEEVSLPATPAIGDDGGAGDLRSSGLRPSKQEPRAAFGGVRLSSIADLPRGQMQQLLMFAWGSASGRAVSTPPGQGGGGGDGAAEPESAAPIDDDSFGSDLGSLAGFVIGDTRQRVVQEKLMLVFLKTLGLGSPGWQASTPAAGAGAAAVPAAAAGESRKEYCKDGYPGGGADSGGGAGVGVANAEGGLPTFLTHSVLRGSSPLRSLFELTAELLQDGTAPEDLEAHIEDLPWAWQGAALRGSDRPVADRPSDAAPAAGDTQNRRTPATCRRFLPCPPIVAPRNSITNQREQGGSPAALTLEEAGLSSGASICFFRAGREAIARKTYGGIVKSLVEDMRLLLRRQGPLGRMHLIKVQNNIDSTCFLRASVDCFTRQPLLGAPAAQNAYLIRV